MQGEQLARVGSAVLEHPVRTAVMAMASSLIAQLFRLPEGYWPPITTLVITQSSLGAALRVSWERLVGTILGAVIGAMVHSDRSAYRFAGVTLAIVLLIPRTKPPWQIALHRFAEVSIGIGVALLLTTVWPEREEPRPGKT